MCCGICIREARRSLSWSVIHLIHWLSLTLPLLESRMVFRTMLHGFRLCLQSMKKCEAPVPDGTLISRLFKSSLQCMSFFDPDHKVPDQNEPIESFGLVLAEINLHVFQEVWNHNVEFFFRMRAKAHDAAKCMPIIVFARGNIRYAPCDSSEVPD
jgi:hypothetical protein